MKPTQIQVLETTTVQQKVALIVGMIAAFLVGMAIIVVVAPTMKTEVATVTTTSPQYAIPVDTSEYERDFSIPTTEALSTTTAIAAKASDTEIPLDIKEPIVSFSVDGSVTLDQKDSYARVILIDSVGHEFLVADASFPFDEITELHSTCQETCLMDPVTPVKLRIELSKAFKQDEQGKFIEDLAKPTASINISKINYLAQGKTINAGVTKASVTKAQQDFKIKTFNNLGRYWVAGETAISKLSYSDKKKLFGDGKAHNLCGYEYYSGGIFEFCERGNYPTNGTEPISPATTSGKATGEKSGNYTFDWRSRHGQDWMTPVKDQEQCGSCWAHSAAGTVEAGINTYFNRLLNIKLSEQDLVSCSGGGTCAGGHNWQALDYIKSTGVVDYDCFPYANTDASCANKCANWQSKVWKITNYSKVPSRTYAVKKALVDKGPLAMSYWPWNHEIVLAGFGEITAATPLHTSGGGSYYMASDDPLIGTTYWLIKNSWGTTWWGEQGYGRVSIPNGIMSTSDFYALEGALIQPTGGTTTVLCTNSDNDGYCWWGVGPKPASGCPPTCAGNNVPDCDDANGVVGACTNATVCGSTTFATGGETQPFGDYQSYGASGCCGDNPGEYYISSASKCCSNPLSSFETQVVDVPTLTFGSYGSGTGQLYGPKGIFVSGTEVYVADTYNHRIEVFNTSGTYQRSWGTQGTGDTQFSFPEGVMVSGSEVYVADTGNNQVKVFNTSGGFIRKWGGSGTGNGLFNAPRGVVVSGGEVYVSDSGNNRIQVFTTAGTFLRKWGTWGSGNGSFSEPRGLTMAGGELYVADYGNGRVQVFTPTGGWLRKWGTIGNGDGQFQGAHDIVVVGSDVYVSDHVGHRIQVFTTGGTFTRKFGQGIIGYPAGLSSSADGKVFVVEEIISRVQVFTRSSEQVCIIDPSEVHIKAGLVNPPTSESETLLIPLDTTAYFQGSATDRGAAPGVCNGCSYQWILDGTVAANSQSYSLLFSSNIDIGKKHTLKLRVTDPQSHANEKTMTLYSGVVSRLGSEGSGDGQLGYPKGVTISNGEMYVTETTNNRVQVLNASTGAYIRKWGTTGSGNGQFQSPFGIAVAGTEVYVVDNGNNRIQVFNTAGTYQRTIGSQGTGNGFFDTPLDVAVAGGEVYVTDSGNDRVQVFSTAGTFKRTWGTKGTANNQFDNPFGIDVANNLVYVSDEGNDRVQVFNTSGTYQRTIGVAGSGDGQFNKPRGIDVDGGQVEVVDEGNHRIQVFKSNGTFLYVWRSIGNNDIWPQDVSIDSRRIYLSVNSEIQVFNEPDVCSDGTIGGSCSGNQYCKNGQLINDCRYCGYTCTGGQQCDTNTGQCITPPVCNNDGDCADGISCNVDHCNFGGTASAYCSHSGGTCCANGTALERCTTNSDLYCNANGVLENRCVMCGCANPTYFKCDYNKHDGTGGTCVCRPDPAINCCIHPCPCRPASCPPLEQAD